MSEPNTNKWLRWECETCLISWDIQMPGFPGSGLDEGMHAHVVYEQNQLDWTCFGPITAQLIPPPRPLKSSHLQTPLGVHPQRTPERTPAPSVSAQPSQTPPPLCSPSLFLPAKVSDTREKRNRGVARHEEPEDCTAALCSEHEATEEPPYPRCPAWTWLDAPDQPQRCLRLVRHTGDHRWWP